MANPDILGDLLSSDPNEPATKGIVLLLRAEMKSEFKSVRTELGEVKQDIKGLKEDVKELKEDMAVLKRDVIDLKDGFQRMGKSMDLIAQQTAQILKKIG